MLGDQRLRPWCMFLCWCLQEAPGSPAVHSYTAKPDLQVCHRFTCRSQDILCSFPPLDTKLCFYDPCFPPFALKTLAFGLLLQRQYPEVGTPVPALSRSLLPPPVPCVLLSCLRLSASLDVMTWGSFPSRWIWWRYSGMVHLLGIFLSSSMNTLQ